jgi:hypothetical protein
VHRGIVTPISTNQPGQGVNRFTVDDIKRETARAFKPLRCEVQDFDYDSGFALSVFDAEDPALVYGGKQSNVAVPRSEGARRGLSTMAHRGRRQGS